LASILKQQYPLTTALHLKKHNLLNYLYTTLTFKAGVRDDIFRKKKKELLSKEYALKKGTNALTIQTRLGFI